MNTASPNENVVLEGTFLYAGVHECDIRIVYSSTRFGSGDYEDPPEISDDTDQDIYYLQYGSTTERGVFNAGGGGFCSLAEAEAAAEAAPGIGPTIKWRR